MTWARLASKISSLTIVPFGNRPREIPKNTILVSRQFSYHLPRQHLKPNLLYSIK